MLKNIFSMLVGLIRKTSPDRVCESPVVYQTDDNDNDKDKENESIMIGESS